ncbi:MAG: LuxR C-terminal-related transcriptional regulator, partial [Oscillospiraceae bacterium]|nr:LuxR C-terminal-related transcriptional regulator [Oscillospiraceae bacterium]
AGSLVLIESEHLRYTPKEFSHLLETNGLPLSRHELDALYGRTEGRPLAAGALIQARGAWDAARELLGRIIRAEVWDKRREDEREFMLRVAVADSLYPALCDRMSGRDDSAALLERLRRENVFISGDPAGGYRFHGFFKEFLLTQAACSKVIYLETGRLKAAKWCYAQKRFDRAAEYSLQCGALAQCSRALGKWIGAGASLPELASVLERLPASANLAHNPWLLCAAAYGAYLSGRPEEQLACLDRLPGGGRGLVQDTAALLRLLDPRNRLAETLGPAGRAFAADGGRLVPSVTQGFPFVHRSFRDFSEFAAMDDAAVRAYADTLPPAALPVMRAAYAGLCYERSDYGRALEHIRAAAALMEEDGELPLSAKLLEAEIRYARNERAEGDRMLRDAERLAQDDPFLARGVRAFRARRRFRQKDAALAREWVRQHGAPLFERAAFYDGYIHFTTARALLCVNEPEQALLLLAKLRKQARQYGRPLDAVETDLLSAIAHNRCRHAALALDAMASALRGARAHGYTELFLAEAADIYELINEMSFRMAQSGSAGDADGGFLNRLCARAGKKLGRSGVIQIYRTQPPVKLTGRQAMAAGLLAKGYSYQEIADALSIKHSTAKSYLRELYNKLGVFNIEGALDKLYEMRILREGL